MVIHPGGLVEPSRLGYLINVERFVYQVDRRYKNSGSSGI